MKHRNSIRLALSAAALLGAAATGSAAGPFSLNFDGPGSTAEAFAPSFLTIGYGQYVQQLDGNGDGIPGSEHWELDPSSGSVPVIDPSTIGYGSAPSPSKALDAISQTVLFLFDSPFDVTHFSTVLDNSTFGSLGTQNIDFFDASDALLFSLPTDQSTPGFTASYDGLLTGVSKVVLPGSAFYDNVNVVPEPGSLASLAGGVALLLGWHRRRRA